MQKLYLDLVSAEGFLPDQAQEELIERLGTFQQVIDTDSRNIVKNVMKKLSKVKQANNSGLYVWGEVGRGKSMIMDLFFQSLVTKKKLKTHFHEFMLDAHRKLNMLKNKHKAEDYIEVFAKNLKKKYQVICFDELQINNIADAMIIGRLFEALIAEGVFIFFSSNRVPDDLFKDGLQRERFLPFIEQVKSKLQVFNLDNYQDYRLVKLENMKKVFFTPNSDENNQQIDALITQLIGDKKLAEVIIDVDDNHQIQVLHAYGKVAVFSFNELCQMPLGAIDYLEMCNRFSTIIIKNIPKMDANLHNEALRFITLIDCMYEKKTKLICSMEVPIAKLYSDGRNSFEFNRTASRLAEMQSAEYLKLEILSPHYSSEIYSY